MIKLFRGSRGIAAAVGALALLGLASCADMASDDATGDDQQQPSAALPGGKPGQPGAAGQMGSGSKVKAPPYATDKILVRFKSGVARTSSLAVTAKHGTQVLREYRVPTNLQVVSVPKGASVEQAVEDFKRDPEVMYAEPNYIYELATVPNDPQFNQLYGMNNTGQTGGTPDADINAVEAWNITTGSNNVVIGLLDGFQRLGECQRPVRPLVDGAGQRDRGLTWIGEVVAGSPGARLSRAGAAVDLRGYEHLR